MNKKWTNLRPGRCALLVMLWLVPGLLARGGDDTNRFPSPLPAEQFVLNHLMNQGGVDLATNSTSASALVNRTVTGRFLEWLLTKNVAQLSHDGLRLKNAVIEGPVDLSNVEVPVQAWLSCCHFKKTLNLSGAHFDHDLSFEGCLFDGDFQASALRVDGSLEFKSFYLRDPWKTGSAEAPPDEAGLGGYLLTNQTIQTWAPGQGEFVFNSHRLARKWVIEDPRQLNPTHQWTNVFEVTASGKSLLLVQKNDDVPAQTTDSVMNLTVGPLTNQWRVVPDTGALDLDSVRTQLTAALGTNLEFIREQVLTTNATSSAKTVRWLFDNPTNSDSLPLVARWLGNPTVNFLQPTVFRKAMRLDGANIAGKLVADEVEFRTFWGHSLKVGDDLVMTDARFDEDAGFIYAQIGHDCVLKGSAFNKSFNASGMSVGGSLILDEARFGSRADFDVVTVGNDFKSPYVRFENRSTLTEFRGLKVNGLVDFQRAFFAGPANFILGHIKGNFQAPGAIFADNHPFQELQDITQDSFTFNVDFGSMTVEGFAIFENVLFTRSVSFRNARFGNLYFDGTHWPGAGVLAGYTNDPGTNDLLRLENMDFETIRDISSGHFLHTEAQLQESQKNLLRMFADRSPYSFDIYAKLESYFQREGAPQLADGVFVNGKVLEGRETASPPAKFANAFLRWTVGYGRNPLLAFSESFGCFLIWGLLCQRCMMKKSTHKKAPGFGLALFFSLGTFLPLIDLGAGDLLECRPGKEWFRYLIALEKILGYILIPLWTMALTGLIK